MEPHRYPHAAKPAEGNDLGWVAEIPPLPGSYALLLRLDGARRVRVGIAMGEIDFDRGDYFYLGSARGPGGLRARLGRHLLGGGRRRWHVDSLRAVSAVRGSAYALGEDRLECRWSRALAALPGAGYAAEGFGASDCRTCPAHLVRLASGSLAEAVRSLSAECSTELVWTDLGLRGIKRRPGVPGLPGEEI